MAKHKSLPQHVAIVMDGNGRWAKKRLLPRTAGHRAAVNRVKELIKYSSQVGLGVLTLYAFSSENWRRPADEVDTLMSLFMNALQNEVAELHKNQVVLRFIGDRSRLAPDLADKMAQAEALTGRNSGLVLCVAVNYGAKTEITQVVQSIASDVVSGVMSIDGINEDSIAQRLYTKGLPDVDLWIRTSGEQRLSNFLLWQVAYGELYFTETLFPAFDQKAFQQALDWYALRERRFGQTSEQL